jgi:hypothetical protein
VHLPAIPLPGPQGTYDLLEMFNARRWIVPTSLPLWESAYQKTRRWIGNDVLATV